MLTLLVLIFLLVLFASFASLRFMKENTLLSMVFFVLPLDIKIFSIIFPDHKLSELNVVPMDFIIPILVLFYFYKLTSEGIKAGKYLKFILILLVFLSFIPIYLSKHISHSLIDYYQNIISPIFLFAFCFKFLEEETIYKLCRIMIISLTLYCIYAFAEHFLIFQNPFDLISFNRQDYSKFQSIFGQRNALSIKIIRILPFAFFFVYFKRKFLDYSVCAFLSFTLIITFSRAGWLAFFTMFILMVVLLRKSKTKILISLVLLIGIIIFIYTNEILAWRLLEPFYQRQVTFTNRTFIWLYGLDLLQNNLWTGFSRLDFVMNAGYILNFDINIGSTHNLFLDLLLFIGLPGFIVLILFMAHSLITNYRLHRLYRRNYFYTFLLISQLLFILHGLGENTYFGSSRSCTFWILAAIVYRQIVVSRTQTKKANSDIKSYSDKSYENPLLGT